MEVVWAWILEHFGISSSILVIILASLIQISPIKINPWTAIKNFFVAPANTAKDVLSIKDDIRTNTEKIETLTSRVDNIDQQVNDISQKTKDLPDKIDKLDKKITEETLERSGDHYKDMRRAIISFSEDITCGVSHNREHYDEIIHIIDDYKQFCKTHPEFPNSRCEMSIQFIEETYRKLFYQ